uniref:Uncharacterized protein n=1 Tax=Lotharella oceanica TaxID=641309 RepID=A0A7S2TK75_9EUKA
MFKLCTTSRPAVVTSDLAQPEVLCDSTPMAVSEECVYQDRGTHKVQCTGSSTTTSSPTTLNPITLSPATSSPLAGAPQTLVPLTISPQTGSPLTIFPTISPTPQYPWVVNVKAGFWDSECHGCAQTRVPIRSNGIVKNFIIYPGWHYAQIDDGSLQRVSIGLYVGGFVIN